MVFEEIVSEFIRLGINFTTFFTATALSMIIIDKNIFENKWNFIIPIAVGSVAYLAFQLYDPNKILQPLSIPLVVFMGIFIGIVGKSIKEKGI